MARVAVAMLAAAVLVSCARNRDASLASPPSTTSVPATRTETTTTVTVTDPTTSSVVSAGPCPPSALDLEMGEGRAALGRGLYVFELRNTSRGACRLQGSPKVVVVDGGGAVLAEAEPAPGRILPDRGPSPVALGPGDSAFFGLESTNVCRGGGRPTVSSAVQVTLPKQEGAPLIVEATITVCPDGPVLVSPVRASEGELTR